MAARLRWLVRASVAVLGLGASLLPGAAAAGGTAASTATHVAIVISGHGTACVRAGATGDTILNQVAQVAYRPSDHLIWQIDGQPTPAFADADHYWSYWHDIGGRWQYSSFGANSYQPAPGTVEGWRYVDGQPNASPPPWNPGGLYASICGAQDPNPAPSTAHRTTSRPAPSTVTHHARVLTTARARPTTAIRGVEPTSTALTSRSTVSSRASSRTLARPAPAVSVTGRATATGSSPPSGAAISPLAKPTSGSAGSPVPAVIGIALVALVGSGGVWIAMRRRRTG